MVIVKKYQDQYPEENLKKGGFPPVRDEKGTRL